MTTEELIVGHFDESLTSVQEGELQELLNNSSEARSLYEQHGALQRLLVSDMGTLAPSSRLDDVAIAAALGTAPEVIASGAAGWLSGKVAAAVALVAVGGVSVALLSSSGSKSPAPSPAPMAQPAPAVVPAQPPAPAPVAELPKESTPATGAAAKSAPAAKLATRGNVSDARKSRRARTSQQLSIDTNETTVLHSTKTRDAGGK